jgi:hypothetical protein
MPMVYGFDGAPATPYTTHATPNTEDPTLVLRGGARNADVQAIYVQGRGASLTAITGIGYRIRRWTTAGTGGTAVVGSPRRAMGAGVFTACLITAADKVSAITAGTVSGVYQLAFSCGAAGPGGWVAPNPDSTICIEGGSSDELDINSVCGVTAMAHHVSAEVAE